MSTSTATVIADRFGAPLPRGLREQVGTLTWERFIVTYGPTSGPVRLGRWAHTGPGSYQATLAVGDHIDTATVTACGPLAALTAMLHGRGIALEMLRFHQLTSGDHTATFIEGTDGRRARWAMGWSTDATESALSAVIACANRLQAG
ncbi:homocitrate synthase [Mycobacterium sp. pUA109]|uniref:homocitrate synthase n=1 Tax=Mycobacterium sp. pUA109 TaxID=3238982 RepID=UPI00351B9820